MKTSTPKTDLITFSDMANDGWYSQFVDSWKLAGKIVKIEMNKAMKTLHFHFEDGGVGRVEACDTGNGEALVFAGVSYANVQGQPAESRAADQIQNNNSELKSDSDTQRDSACATPSCSDPWFGSEEMVRETISNKIKSLKSQAKNLENLLEELPKGMSRNFYANFL